eukprot:TRINITY_DN24838_c0_g1_i1.p1 TRINITY_DN24838_c0_g1~~TRINITY_DN24838_c0_g1_i1.p1  ORF type:complete len:803 (+),score=158.54 TRINITY_DN24838_c0_g1_i1:1557-3965(+)
MKDAELPLSGLLRAAADPGQLRSEWAERAWGGLRERGWLLLRPDDAASEDLVRAVAGCYSQWAQWSSGTPRTEKAALMDGFGAAHRDAAGRGCGWWLQELREQWHCQERDEDAAPWPSSSLRAAAITAARHLRTLLQALARVVAASGACAAASCPCGEGEAAVEQLLQHTAPSVIDFFDYHSREATEGEGPQEPGVPQYWPCFAGHVDPGFLTVLPIAAEPGMQFRGRDGSWHAVEEGPQPLSALAVFGGVLLQQLTGGATQAVVHRVARPPGRPRRFSLVYELRAPVELSYASGLPRPVAVSGRVDPAAAASSRTVTAPRGAWQVREAPGRGRGLFASRALRPGEILISEPPIAYAIAPQQAGGPSVCTHCLEGCEEPCEGCGMVLLHSGCKGRGWHDAAECAALGHYTPPCSLVCVLRLLRALRSSPPPETLDVAGMDGAALCAVGRPAMLALARTLETHAGPERPAEELRGTAMNARILREIAAVCGCEGFEVGEVADWLLRLDVNGVPVSDIAGSSCGAAALYPVTALLNHSCRPNAVLCIDSSTAVHAVVMREVAAGEELCISYCHEWGLREQRRSGLRSAFYFDCQCARCTEGDSGEELQWGRCVCPVCGAAAHSPEHFAPVDFSLIGGDPHSLPPPGTPDQHSCSVEAARALWAAVEIFAEASDPGEVERALAASAAVTGPGSVARANWLFSAAQLLVGGEQPRPERAAELFAAAAAEYESILRVAGGPAGPSAFHPLLGSVNNLRAKALHQAGRAESDVLAAMASALRQLGPGGSRPEHFSWAPAELAARLRQN